MSGWVDLVVESHVEAESPARFQYWSALSAISATVKKNVHLNRHYYKLYPNVYVFLVGKSGLRKGNPVSFAKKLVQEVNTTRIITGRNSIQAVLKELGKAHSIEGGGVLKDASAFLVSGELAAFLVEDPQALTILTDLYNTHENEPEWKNTLKTSGVDTLRNPCITLLGATNEDHFKAAVPDNAIGGGFIARTLIVFEQRRRSVNDLMDAPKIVPSIADLSCYLKELSKVSGEFKISPEAKAFYRQWYAKLSSEEHDDRTGTFERMGDTTLKVAMLVSLANSFELVIKEAHIVEAVGNCMACVEGLRQVTMGQGKSDLAHPTALVLKDLLTRQGNQVKRTVLLSKYWGEFDSITLDKIIQTLVDTGSVEMMRLGKGDIMYTMQKWAVDKYKKYKVEIN